MRFVPIYQITPDMIAARNIEDDFGRTLITKGSKISKKVCSRLKDFNIFYVCIEDSWSDGVDIDPVINETVINKSAAAIKNLDFDKVFECTSKMVNELCSSKELMNDMEMIKNYDRDTYLHSVNVAINSVTLAIGLQMNYKKINNIAIGAMLHDIGKNKIPENILNKREKLNKKEMELIKKHPEFGFELLSKNILISASIKAIVRQHHENWDGSGYPDKLIGNNIYDLALIIHICDVYDALRSKRPYKEACSYKQTIEELKKNSGKMFNPEILESFFKFVPIYHKGTEIKLNNNATALVIKNNRGDMLNPVIRLENGTEIDLRDSKYDIIS